ncbi:MAG: sigma-70 family RNA polymerase sigma factor [Desulfobacteraceae bacterium]|nr:sigma-70 family RNA polymerase sigma factor [Desulfobacteraceae bacterium]
MVEFNEQLPCDGCGAERSSCVRACSKLHNFLREDSKCHTKVYTRETLVDPQILQDRIADDETVWHSNAPEYWDIMNIEGLSFGDRELLIDRDVLGLSHQQMAKKWKISIDRINRHFIRIKKERAKLRKN